MREFQRDGESRREDSEGAHRRVGVEVFLSSFSFDVASWQIVGEKNILNYLRICG